MSQIKRDNASKVDKRLILAAVLIVLIAVIFAAFIGGFSSVLANGRTLCFDCIGIL